MVQHRRPSESADPPITPEQLMVYWDLVMSFMRNRGYEEALADIGSLLDGRKSVQQIQIEWQDRRGDPAGLMAQAFAAVEKEFKGMKFSFKQAVVLFLYRVCDLEYAETEECLGIRHVPNIISRIRQAAEMRQQNAHGD